MGGGTTISNVNWTQAEAKNFVEAVAYQCFGSRSSEGVKGGRGSIGMIGGRPTKFNTHWWNRGGKPTAEMIKSSNELRMSLYEAAMVMEKDLEACNRRLDHIRNLLGIREDGTVKKGGVLSRKTAIDVIKTIRDDIDNDNESKFGSQIMESDLLRMTRSDRDFKSSRHVDTRFSTLMGKLAGTKDQQLSSAAGKKPGKAGGVEMSQVSLATRKITVAAAKSTKPFVRTKPTFKFGKTGLTIISPKGDKSIPARFKDKVGSVKTNPCRGDDFFYSALDSLSSFGAVSNCETHAVDLRHRMVDHAKSLLKKAEGAKEFGKVLPGLGYDEKGENLTVPTSRGRVNVERAAWQIMHEGDVRNDTLAHGAFLADLLKRPVVILSEASANAGRSEYCRFDCDLKSGKLLTGEPVYLLQDSFGTFRSFEPTPEFLQQLQQP